MTNRVDVDGPDCAHVLIETFGDGENGPALWACADCRLRFYPACRTCVDVGHRNIDHPVIRLTDESRTVTRASLASALANELHFTMCPGKDMLRRAGSGPQGWPPVRRREGRLVGAGRRPLIRSAA